ncbi:MAG: flippase [Synergistaceae bacterium]|nr:flippase [Synergistaceae bacterium]
MAAKSIKRNYIYNLAYQVLLLITPFITTPYVSRVLLPYGVGVISFAFAVTQYFGAFAGMGVSTFGRREVSYYQDNRHELTQVFWELKILTLITSLVCFVIYMTLAMIYVRNNHLVYIIFSTNILLGVTLDVAWFFAGMEEFVKLVVRNTIVKICDIAFIFLFIKKPTDVPLYVFGSVFFNLMSLLSLWPELPKYIDWPDWKTLEPFRNIRVIWSLFVPTIAVQVYTVLDKLMLGVIASGPAENGYYELALRIARMAMMVVTSLGSVMIPRIGYLYKKNDHAKIMEYMYRSFRFTWFISVPMCLGLIAVSDNFVLWFFGANYARVAGLLKISSFLLVFVGLSYVTGGQYLIPTGRQNLYTITVTIGAAVNFLFNTIFIRHYQADGALIASVIAEAVVALSQIYFLSDELSLMKILWCGKNYIFAGLVMFGVLMSFNKGLPSSPRNTFMLIFVGAAVYFAVLFVLRDEAFTMLSNKLRRKNKI